MKKIVTIILCLLLAGCGTKTNEEKIVESFDWSMYDQLIADATVEQDIVKRNKMLHEAEEMLIDTGAAIPLFEDSSYYLKKSDVMGLFVDSLGNVSYKYINSIGKDKLSINVSSEPPVLDPQYQLLYSISTVWDAIGCTLLTIDENENLISDLADHYEVSDDGLVYRFYLRDNLKWSDGETLDADDFVYSWKRMATRSFGFESSEFCNIIKGYPDNLAVESLEDGKVFEVTLNSPCVYFTSLITYPSFNPLRQDIIESAPGYSDANGNITNPTIWSIEAPLISCGAYTVEKWVHNESITLKKNPYYYDAENVKTETVELMLNSDAAVCYAAYESGDICVLFSKIPTDVLETLFDNPEFYSSAKLGSNYIQINVKSDIFAGMSVQDAKTFRKALGYVIDRKFITQIISKPEESAKSAIVPVNTQDGSGHKFCENYAYPYEYGYYPIEPDLNKAREMLESIGLEFNEDGKLKNPINIEYQTNPGSTNEAVATCLQADFARIGINLTISTTEFAVFLGNRMHGDYEFARGQWGLDYNDPISMLAIFATNNPNNDSQLGR